jgi:hypothetical protein
MARFSMIEIMGKQTAAIAARIYERHVLFVLLKKWPELLTLIFLAVPFQSFLFHRRLCLAVPSAIYERPQTIWRPLERSLGSGGSKFRLPRFVRVLVWIGRGIGQWYFVLHASYAAPAFRIAG